MRNTPALIPTASSSLTPTNSHPGYSTACKATQGQCREEESPPQPQGRTVCSDSRCNPQKPDLFRLSFQQRLSHTVKHRGPCCIQSQHATRSQSSPAQRVLSPHLTAVAVMWSSAGAAAAAQREEFSVEATTQPNIHLFNKQSNIHPTLQLCSEHKFIQTPFHPSNLPSIRSAIIINHPLFHSSSHLPYSHLSRLPTSRTGKNFPLY